MFVYSKNVFSLQFGQEKNILGHSLERRAYRFVLKATQGMMSLFPNTGRVQSRLTNPLCKR